MWGNLLALGGSPKDITPLQFSLYNFGGINSTELLNIGSPDEFQYLLCTKESYLESRSKNIVLHLGWNYKGKDGRIPWSIANNRAKAELESIKKEDFLKCLPYETISYSLGHYDRDLSDLNTKYQEATGNLNLVVDKDGV